MSEMTESNITQFQDECNSNDQTIICERCQSVVLLPKKAKNAKIEKFLPHMKKKSEQQEPDDGETLEEFWLVDDMFTFENVGFSNAVDGIKYLVCADCEIGPIGYHDTKNQKEFYIAHKRIQYKQ